jgi:glutathione S-transferase
MCWCDEYAFQKGDRYTFADINLMPILYWLRQFPEGQRLPVKSKGLAAFYDRNTARPGFLNTVPPIPSR